jgi:uncharacterized membrane protein
MGSEIIVLLVPIGIVILLFLSYRIVRGPDRAYPAVSLIAAMSIAGYLTAGARNHYLDWFFIWFTLAVVPLGIAAHALRWAVRRKGLANG